MKTPPPAFMLRNVVLLLSVLGGGFLGSTPAARAASQTWSSDDSSANWSAATNWGGNAAPGSTSTTTSTDVATFNSAVVSVGSGANPIIIDSATQDIGSIVFAVGAGSYTLGTTGGNAISLTTGAAGPPIIGTIELDANSSVTINAPLILYGNATSDRIVNNSASGTLVIGGAITSGVNGATSFQLRGSNTTANTVSGIISNGSGASSVLGLNKTDAGTWYLTAVNTFTGNVSINQGILSINSIANAGVASALGAGTTISFGQAGFTTDSLQFTGASGGSTDRSIVILNGSGSAGASFENTVAGQTLTLSGNLTTQTAGTYASLTLKGAGNGVFSGNITGSPIVAVNKSGTGTWTLSGTNTNTNVTTVSGGTLQYAKEVSLFNDATASWTATNLVVNSGSTLAFNVGGTGEFTAADIGILAALGTSSGGFKSGSAIGFDTTNAGGGVFSYGTAIANTNGGSNTVALKKLGANTLVLSGANTYTGATSVLAGTLSVTGSLGATAVGVASGATLTGTGSIAGATSINSGGILAAGTAAGTTLTLGGGLATVSGSTLTFVLGSLGAHSTLALGGASTLATGLKIDFLNVQAGTYNNLITGLAADPTTEGSWTLTSDDSGYSAVFSYSSGNISAVISAVPEPSTWALLAGAAGLAAMAGARRRRDAGTAA